MIPSHACGCSQFHTHWSQLNVQFVSSISTKNTFSIFKPIHPISPSYFTNLNFGDSNQPQEQPLLAHPTKSFSLLRNLISILPIILKIKFKNNSLAFSSEIIITERFFQG